jgi:hypothetical protein
VGDRDDRDARPAIAGMQQALQIERLTLEPGTEAGRGEQVVDGHRQAEAILGRVESLEVEHAHLLEGRLLDRADQAGEVERAALAPGSVEDGGQQDVLAALQRVGGNADQPEQPGDHAAHPFAQRGRLGGRASLRRFERAQHRQRQAGVAARRVDGHVRRVAEVPYARAVLAPLRQPLAPGLGHAGRPLGRRDALALRLRGVDPGREVGGGKVREGQQQVRDVALGVDDQRRDAVEGRFLEQRDAQAGLAGAGHADADGVRRQVLRVVQQRRGRKRPGGGVVLAAEIEDAELLEVLHVRWSLLSNAAGEPARTAPRPAPPWGRAAPAPPAGG